MGLAYHDYEGVALRDDEKVRLVADLGGSKQMILRNHGLLTCGRTVSDAFLTMYTLESACRVQILAQSGGTPLTLVPEAVSTDVGEQARQATKGKGSGLAWPGLLRRLDRIQPDFRN
jgi:ribulose-5-phosphate 4-epimerase/fuculose-1-phosphate aldolase